MACSDIEEAQFVRPRLIIGLGLLDRIAGVLQVDKIHALDHPAIGNIETGNDADADCHPRFAILIAVARSSRPS